MPRNRPRAWPSWTARASVVVDLPVDRLRVGFDRVLLARHLRPGDAVDHRKAVHRGALAAAAMHPDEDRAALRRIESRLVDAEPVEHLAQDAQPRAEGVAGEAGRPGAGGDDDARRRQPAAVGDHLDAAGPGGDREHALVEPEGGAVAPRLRRAARRRCARGRARRRRARGSRARRRRRGRRGSARGSPPRRAARGRCRSAAPGRSSGRGSRVGRGTWRCPMRPSRSPARRCGDRASRRSPPRARARAGASASPAARMPRLRRPRAG